MTTSDSSPTSRDMTDSDQKSPWPYRWDLLLRYRYIEIISQWEGRLTTGHLSRCFGLGRQQASKDISIYRREIAPGNIEYDKYLKGYKPTSDFVPRITRGSADEYLHLMNRDQQLMGVFEALPLTTNNFEQLLPPARHVTPAILRPMVQAARQQLRLEVDYVSLHQPDRQGRIIVPHTLVFSGFRWHVRAWCEKNRDYRDFVLSRFRGEAELLDASTQGVEGDANWAQKVTVSIAPDSRLDAAQRDVIAQDFGMTDGRLAIETRATLVSYLLRLLQLDPDHVSENPRAQQVVLENREELEPWLFS